MKFVPNLTNDDNRMEVRQNWDMLMPREYLYLPFWVLKNFQYGSMLSLDIHGTNEATVGSGAIRIPDHERHPLLGQPQYSHHHAGPIFETAWTHALHCVRIAFLPPLNHPLRPSYPPLLPIPN